MEPIRNPLFEITSLFLTNVISIILEKSLYSYNFFVNNELAKNQDNLYINENFKLDFVEKPSKSTMRNNENSSNNDSTKNIQKTPEEKKTQRKRKDLIQMVFHKILCKIQLNFKLKLTKTQNKLPCRVIFL